MLEKMSRILDETDSTQIYFKKLLKEGHKPLHLDYVLAHAQTAGQGRQGRSWVSEPGNLFVSIWIRDFQLPVTWIPHFISISLVRVFESYSIPASRLGIKWPNDVLIDGEQKISGILCEKIADGVLAGVGVNLISAPDLQERKTSSLISLSPYLQKTGLNLDFKDRLIHELTREPSLIELQKQYAFRSILKTGDGLDWEDIQTHQKGSGRFLRFGNFGELIAETNGSEKTLLSEEVHLKKLKTNA